MSDGGVSLVPALSGAGVAIGADDLIVEVQPALERSVGSRGSLASGAFEEFVDEGLIELGLFGGHAANSGLFPKREGSNNPHV